jgi:hypothetical protein
MSLLDFVTKGSTDRSVNLRIVDSTDGTPETGVVYNTSGIDLWYRREGAAKVSITEATLAALTTAHTDGGFLHVSDGNYRLDLPDAAFATGANYVEVGGAVTGMIVIGGRVRLTDFNLETATQPVNATQFAGQTITAAAGVTLPSSVASPTNITAGTITTVTNLTNAPSAGDLTATMKTSVGTAVAASAVASVTGNVGGSVGSVVGAVGSVTGAVASVTGNVGGNVTGSIGSLASQAKADVNAEVDTALADAGQVALPTGAVVADGGNSSTVFVTNRTETTTGYWNGVWVVLTSGVMAGQVKQVSGYNGSTKAITVASAFTGTPATGVTFALVNR